MLTGQMISSSLTQFWVEILKTMIPKLRGDLCNWYNKHMKTYKVIAQENNTYEIELEANSVDEARQIANELSVVDWIDQVTSEIFTITDVTEIIA